MTRAEAFSAMKEGHKITHHSFTDEEFLQMQYGIVCDEEGYDFTAGWRMRDTEEWQTGWELYLN